ncbi:TonB-dependent receptor [Terriglobus albidus]|uniref:TonB-dependent receptor n=1 Tax=Terriglobus albidus TaxID=1592106 RepID=A0A5B9EGF5_9BACT|nr:carboxypeptidase regulatory-like domain-containing protein [Terriglobus albidus]QEE30889.1 TonB-dependent receptor [Terriglobus albidus]
MATTFLEPCERIASSRWSRLLGMLALLAVVLMPGMLPAQTGGEGGLQGSVTDSTGAAVPDATIIITNQGTGTQTTRQSTSAGLYSVSPLPPGIYTVDVKHEGFQEFLQKNLTVNAMIVTGFDVTLTIGATSDVITVLEAPPQLETTNASLGLTIENEAYSNLPLVTNNAQRDATAFGALAPGAQGGARLPIVGGTGNYLGQLYVDGLPAQTVSQQGDNRLVSQAFSIEAIDQTQVLTSTPPVEYSGAGAQNFTIKSGTLKYHGQVSDYIRNTALDAWPLLTKAQTVSDGKGGQVAAPKPVDHQNELSASVGGHVPGTKRVFFFAAYDRYHNRTVRGPVAYTIPTLLERQGDFTELLGTSNPALFDPTTTSCSGGTCTRQPFQGSKNGVPTYNVIPASYLSPFAKAAQQYLPQPSNSGTTNNYLGSVPYGFDNFTVDYRVDFQITPNHRISTVGAIGKVGYLNNYSAPFLPQPYTGGNLATIYPKIFDVQDVYTINNNLVNQLKFGFVRFFQDIKNATQNVPGYQIGDLGVTNLPAGQAGQTFPGMTFTAGGASSVALQTWTGASDAVSTQKTTPNNYTVLDNVLWTKGKHSVTAGIQVQWQQINNANPDTYTGLLQMVFNNFSTANFGANSQTLSSSSGYSYASYLLGAIGGSPSLQLRPVSEVGGRYRPIAPYVSDTWRITEKLTLDAGLRWDYLPPYREVKDRWSFLNPNLTNPVTGTPGAIQFAGNYGGATTSCQCRTPVQTYWQNWGPRVGLTYALDDKTVLRIGIGRVFSQGGGVGGRGGAFNGTGQLGFNTSIASPAEVTTGAGAGPSYYLNNSSAFQTMGRANTALFGGQAYPTAPTPGAATLGLNTGFYLSNGRMVTGQGVSFADPYFSGRAPNFTFYNVGIQHSLTKDMVLAINYVGNQSHHLINSTSNAANARGYWSNQLNPIYLAGLGSVTATDGKTPILIAPATSANVAKAQAAMPGIKIPQNFQDAAAASNGGAATIAQGLTAFPQYSGVTDTWGNVGNFSYNSLQVTVQQRMSRGLTFNFNYTWSKNVGNDGTFRSGFAIPQAAISGGTQSWAQDRIDRGVTTISSPHTIHAYGVWKMPFGKNGFGGNHLATRLLLSDWQLSNIFTYSTGTPVAVVWNTDASCNTLSTATGSNPLQGRCMPDVNPSYVGSGRTGNNYGKGGTSIACNLGGAGCSAAKYLDSNAFQAPRSVSTGSTPVYLLGNASRTQPFGLKNPAALTLDAALRRTIPIREAINFQFEVTASNVLNHPVLGNPNAQWGTTAFGTITGVSSASTPRSFQLAGHLNF